MTDLPSHSAAGEEPPVVFTPPPGLTFASPKLVWKWDMFGGGQLIITITDQQMLPSWRQRIMTRLLFGSRWTRLNEEK